MGRGRHRRPAGLAGRGRRPDGAATLAVPCLVSPRNVPLRLALAAAGFRAAEGGAPDRPAAVFTRALAGPLPELPELGDRRPDGRVSGVTGRSDAAAGPRSSTSCGRSWPGSPGARSCSALGEQAPLFGAGVGLDSLTGTLLLREVHRRFGVDVAAEDLNLDALATLGTLAAFIEEHTA